MNNTMSKYGDLLKKCDDRRKTIEEEREEKERQKRITKYARLTKCMRSLATLLKDVENISDISMSYEGFTNHIHITFKDTIYNLVRSNHDLNVFIDPLLHSYNISKYIKKDKSLIPNLFSFNYREPMLSIEYGDDLKITKGVSIYITWTKEMNIDDAMEIVIKRLEDGYDI